MLDVVDVVVLTLVAAVLVAVAQYIFKKWVHKFNFSLRGILSIARNRMVMLGVLVYLAGLAFYLLALGSGALSFVYPAFSSTFIFVMIISHYKLGEKVGYARLAGILLIMAGIAMVSIG